MQIKLRTALKIYIFYNKCTRTQVPPPPAGARNVTSAPCRAVMMAVRERAVKVMAALERRVPCLDDFLGQSWSVWTERANLTASEGEWALRCRYFSIHQQKVSRMCFIFRGKGTASRTMLPKQRTCRVLVPAGLRACALSLISVVIIERVPCSFCLELQMKQTHSV